MPSLSVSRLLRLTDPTWKTLLVTHLPEWVSTQNHEKLNLGLFCCRWDSVLWFCAILGLDSCLLMEISIIKSWFHGPLFSKWISNYDELPSYSVLCTPSSLCLLTTNEISDKVFLLQLNIPFLQIYFSLWENMNTSLRSPLRNTLNFIYF